MKLRAAVWSSTTNYLIVTCTCGWTFQHRTDRHRVQCPRCSRRTKISQLRGQRLPEIEQ